MKFIVTSDWHLRKSVPVCRTENEQEWFNFQFDIIEDIFNKANLEADAKILVAGDIFDRSVPSIKIINRLLMLREKHSYLDIYGIAGNHDLPYHNFNIINESGYDTLTQSKFFSHDKNITEHHFNTDIPKVNKIVLCHHLCFKDEKSIPPHIEAVTAKDLLEMYPAAKLIVCGDNHHGFVYRENGRTVIVPGAINIQSVGEFDIIPAVHLVELNSDYSVKSIELLELFNPADRLTSSHVDQQKERNARIEDFVDMLQSRKEIGLSFRDNLNAALQSKNIDNSVKEIITEIKETL